MPFCSQCGKPVEAGASCAGCGKSTSEGIEAMTAELRRQRSEMRYMALALGLVLACVIGLVLGWMLHGQRKGNEPVHSVAVQQPAPTSQLNPQPALESPPASSTQSSQSQQPSPAPAPRQKASGEPEPAGGIDVQAIQSAVSGMSQRGGQKSQSPRSTVGPAKQSASDRYPGSEPVDMKDAALPEVGIPVSNQVYSTSDSLSKVLDYYKQLYPDGQVMEISGQTIIAVDRPGETKVIALGTSGSETRIAIVQPGSSQ